MLHPELDRLGQHYQKVVADYNAGSISYQQALEAIASATAIDADGYVWSIDPSTGQFVKSKPGASPRPADPTEFALRRVEDAPPGFPGGLGGLPDFGDFDGFDAGQQRRLPTEDDRPGASAEKGLFGAVKARLLAKENRRTMAIFAAAVLVVFAVSLARKDQGEDVVIPETPTTQDGFAATTVVGQDTPLPTGDDISRVLSALASGEPETAASAVAKPGDRLATAYNVALFHGFYRTGLVVRSGPPAETGDGTVLSTLELVDTDGKVLSTVRARWVQSDGTWKLAVWPDFPR